MAHQEHVEIVRRGKDAINAWIERNPEAKLDLSGAYLGGKELRNANLSGADLRMAILDSTELGGSDLRAADLRGVKGQHANLFNADLRGANLSGSDLSFCLMSGADFRGADLSNVNLSGSCLSYANLEGANCSMADLREADLSNADLRNADLRHANLQKANLGEAYLRNARISTANLSQADITGANLGPWAWLVAGASGARKRKPVTTSTSFNKGIIAFGILWSLGAIWFWWFLCGHPVDDLRLTLWAQTTEGFVTETFEDVNVDEYGREYWWYAYVFEFRADGKQYVKTHREEGRLRDEFRYLSERAPVQVEYLPNDPNISRLRGNGSQSLFEWIWRKLLLGGVLLLMFLYPAVAMIRSELLRVRAARFRRDELDSKLDVGTN